MAAKKRTGTGLPRGKNGNGGFAPKASEAAIWGRVIQPGRGGFSAAAARYFARIELGEDDRKRAHELVVKNQKDALSEDERLELESYRRVGYVLDLLRAKARLALEKQAPAK